MYKIANHLYVGGIEEFKMWKGMPSISILGACKEPLHRTYARLQGSDKDGYLGKAMPKDEPEYLWAERPHALYCNLIDVDDIKYISDDIINRALKFIDDEIAQDRDVLIICNKAQSRSPSIALMWLMTQPKAFNIDNDYADVYDEFKSVYYWNYQPSKGFFEYTRKFWNDLQKKRKCLEDGEKA